MSDGILEPVALLEAIDHAALEIGDVAGHALDTRVADRIDDDVVAEPVDADLADLLGMRDGRRLRAKTVDRALACRESPDHRLKSARWRSTRMRRQRGNIAAFACGIGHLIMLWP